MAKPIVAILYDFDKTLSTTDMQNYDFIPALGMEPDEFWGETGKVAAKYGMERILSYMYCMVKLCKEKGIKLTKEFLHSCGKNIKFYPGVTTWFKRINDYGESKGVKVEHYLVSSGTREIVEGCSIFDEFTYAYGCEFLYDENGEAIWPKLAINFTQKTQMFYRVSKGTLDPTDDAGVNEKSTERRVEYKNIIYIGDGMTDIPSMTLVKKSGGHSIGVYPNDEKEVVQKIHKEERCDYVIEADYTAGSQMDKVIRMLIDLISVQEKLDKKEELLAK